MVRIDLRKGHSNCLYPLVGVIKVKALKISVKLSRIGGDVIAQQQQFPGPGELAVELFGGKVCFFALEQIVIRSWYHLILWASIGMKTTSSSNCSMSIQDESMRKILNSMLD